MTEVKSYEGLPFFIGSGQRVSEKLLPEVTGAIRARFRDVSIWADRYFKGLEIEKAIKSKNEGVVKNVNTMYAYNAYQKFLQTSLLSLKDTFRIYSDDFRVDIDRPTAILKGYLEALQTQNSLIANDAILYGSAAILLDVYLDKDQLPNIQVNRVDGKKFIYDYEQPGVGLFSIRITPEIAYKLDFLPENYKMEMYNRSISSAERTTYIRVFVGDLVVNNKLDTYVAIVYHEQVIYAEKGRELTYLRAVSIYDKNNDFSPIYTVLRATELSKQSIQTIFDYSDQVVNPIRVIPWNLNAEEYKKAQRTKFLKYPSAAIGQLQTLLPGQLDANGIMQIQQLYQTLAQQAAGLNEYTLGEAGGSVRTYGEAMMLADSASGIMNILANKIKTKLILPVLQDILEILKIALAPPISDMFPESLQIDLDIAKDQQESNMLMALINMPMFGAVIQSLDGIQAFQVFRWILNKLHISGVDSLINTSIDNTVNQRPTINTAQQQINNSNNNNRRTQ